MLHFFQRVKIILLSFFLIAETNTIAPQNFYLSPKSEFSFLVPSELRITHFEQAQGFIQDGNLILQTNCIPTNHNHNTNGYFKWVHPAYCFKTKKRLYLAPWVPPYWLTKHMAKEGNSRHTSLYEAWNSKKEKDVVLKALNRETTEQNEKDFRFEYTILQQLNHFKIVKVYEFLELKKEAAKQTLSFVMEKIRGENLDELMQTNNLTVREVLTIGIQAAEALEHVHQHGFIHCDIKSKNLMWDSKDQKLTLIDFGIAIKKGGNPYPNTIRGTPHYLSPEQVNGGFDERTDIYSLGVVLYELCSKHSPFVKEHNKITLTTDELKSPTKRLFIQSIKRIHENRKDVSFFNPRIPCELKNIINKSISFEPKDRYQTATELKQALIQVRDKLAGRISTIITSHQEINVSL